MRNFLLLVLLVACGSSATKYTTKHELAGTGGGFMHVVKREGVIYYYRFEEVPPYLKLNMILHSTHKKPFRIKANDFSLVVDGQEILPFSKLAWLKDTEVKLKTLKGTELKQLASDVDLVNRYMLDADIQLEPQNPTKTYVIFPIQRALNFGVKLGPASPVVKVKQEL